MKRSYLFVFCLLIIGTWVSCNKTPEKSADQLRAEDSTLRYAQINHLNVIHNNKDSIRFTKVKKMEGYRNGQKAPTEYLLYYLADVADTNLVFDMETGVIKEKQVTHRKDVKIEVWLDSTFSVGEYKIPTP